MLMKCLLKLFCSFVDKSVNERKVEMTGHLRTGYFSLESVTALTFVAVTSVGFPMCSPVFVSLLKYFLTTEKML